MIRIGQKAPDFALPGAAAGTIETHGLSEYMDRDWAVILVFYPFDFYPACTDQWCSLRDADWLTLLDDVVVLGVESDGAYAHRDVPSRATFVVDPDHAVQFAWSAHSPDEQPDLDGLRKATNCHEDQCTIDGSEESA